MYFIILVYGVWVFVSQQFLMIHTGQAVLLCAYAFINLCIQEDVNFLLHRILQSHSCRPLFLKLTDENCGASDNYTVKCSVLFCLLTSIQYNQLVTYYNRQSRGDALVRVLALGSSPSNLFCLIVLFILALIPQAFFFLDLLISLHLHKLTLKNSSIIWFLGLRLVW